MAEPRRARRWGTVRLRTTLAATGVVAAALVLGAFVLVAQLHASLVASRRAAAVSLSADIAALAASGHLPPVLGLPNEEGSFAQVITSTGTVLVSSGNISGSPAVGPPVGGRGRRRFSTQRGAAGLDGPFGLVALGSRFDGRSVTVYVGYSLATADLAVSDIRLALLAGVPMLLVVVAATSWIVVGRALRPIAAIRAEVDEITSRDLHRRVPEPDTGDEVARLARTMNAMLDRVERAAERQRAFVADASHELRSPLTALRIQLEVGVAGAERTDWPATAAGALAEEERLERLVSELLLLARLDAGASATRGPPAELADVARRDLAGRPGEPEVTLHAVPGARSRVGLDEHLARRLVANLVDNACRHARRRVEVTVCSEEPSWVELAVADDGPGIAEGDRERVFGRFVRLDSARAAGDGGLGLGLAIVREIVESHGGRVWFADVPVGARVVVRLPAPAGMPAGSGRTPSGESGEGGADRRGRPSGGPGHPAPGVGAGNGGVDPSGRERNGRACTANVDRPRVADRLTSAPGAPGPTPTGEDGTFGVLRES